jgi:hypothetical protein
METNMVAGVKGLIGALALALPLPAFAHVVTADGSEHCVSYAAAFAQQAPSPTIDRQSGTETTNVLMARAARASKRRS